MIQPKRLRILGLTVVTAIITAGPATAAFIMDAESVSVNRNIEYSLVSADEDNNILYFEVATRPVVFTSVTMVFDERVVDGWRTSDPDGVITVNRPIGSANFQFLVDFSGRSEDSVAGFAVELASLPTQVDFFRGLNIWSPVASASFVQAIPEPTAALSFFAGFGLVAATLRRRARR
jgi:hypothetical protein